MASGSPGPHLAVPALPSPLCPGRAGSCCGVMTGCARPPRGCERRGRLLPPSKTGPAGRGALLPQPARPHLCGLSGPRSHPTPARPNQLLRVPAARGQAAAGRAPPGQAGAAGGSTRRAGGAQRTWKSRSSEFLGALGTGGAVSPLVPTGCPRPCCPLLTSPHCVPCPAPHPVVADGPRPRPRPAAAPVSPAGHPKGAGSCRGAAKCPPPISCRLLGGRGRGSISCGQEPSGKDRCEVLQPPADVSGWVLGRAASRGPAPAQVATGSDGAGGSLGSPGFNEGLSGSL